MQDCVAGTVQYSHFGVTDKNDFKIGEKTTYESNI